MSTRFLKAVLRSLLGGLVVMGMPAAHVAGATITVTTNVESPGGSGDCTLGEAIEAANTDAVVDACAAGSGADTIALPAGTYTLINGTTTAAGRSAFVVSSAITIAGPGATLTRDAAVTNLRFFEVTSAGTLTLEGLTLLGGIARGANGINGGLLGSVSTPGEPGRGGAIHNQGTVALRDVLLKKNQAIGGRGGNGATQSGGPSGKNGGAGQGGAVYSASFLEAERTTFFQNDARGGDGGGSGYESGVGIGGAAEGGALHNAATGTVTISDGTFIANRALGGESGRLSLGRELGAPAHGGGIFSRGSVSLTRTALVANQAVGGIGNVGGPGRGGAVAIVAGALTMARGSLNENNATGGMELIWGTGSAVGGALYVESGTATVWGASIARNTVAPGPPWPGRPTLQGTAQGGGAALVDAALWLINTTVSGNWAPDGGGGLHADAASYLILDYVTVAQNASNAGAGGLMVGGPADISGTIIAPNGGGNCQAGAITDLGSNIQWEDGTCGSIPVMDPMLGPRQDSGGTSFHPLLPGSPARDASGLPCPSEDQRGVARPLDGDGDGVAVCDIGAIEADDGTAPSDVIFEDGFDSGDLSAWSGAATDGGDLAASPAAAVYGPYGLRAIVDDTASLHVRDDSPSDEGRYRARFWFDPSAFDPGTASGTLRTRLFIGLDESPQRRIFAVVLRKVSDTYSLMVRTRLDDNTQADTGFFPITPGRHSVEIDWRRATGPDANDGGLQVWIDGASVKTLTGLDNASGGIDSVRLGALSVKAGASGHLDFDSFASRRQTYLGP